MRLDTAGGYVEFLSTGSREQDFGPMLERVIALLLSSTFQGRRVAGVGLQVEPSETLVPHFDHSVRCGETPCKKVGHGVRRIFQFDLLIENGDPKLLGRYELYTGIHFRLCSVSSDGRFQMNQLPYQAVERRMLE